MKPKEKTAEEILKETEELKSAIRKSDDLRNQLFRELDIERNALLTLLENGDVPYTIRDIWEEEYSLLLKGIDNVRKGSDTARKEEVWETRRRLVRDRI